jgi:predicted transcriptional regulator
VFKVTSKGKRGPGRLQLWWVDGMDRGVQVAGEGNLISTSENKKISQFINAL